MFAIRNTFRLPTLVISLSPSPRGEAQVRFQTYHGSERLSEERSIPATELGIPSRAGYREDRSTDFRIPFHLAEWMAADLNRVRNAWEPVWLIVDPSWLQLSTVPWERLLQPGFGAPVLRIPNFIADPVFLSGPLQLALCISSPRAKTPFDPVWYARDVVVQIQNAVSQGTEIHVFADEAAYNGLKHVLENVPPGHEVVIHNPEGALKFGTGNADRNLSEARDKLDSPWLLWMQDELPKGTDAVHFICPGYFSRDRGALALARSPMLNRDSEWSHFVGAQELMVFFQLTGAWSAGFSPLHNDAWAIGHHLVAGKLAWMRSGPVLLHEATMSGPSDLMEAYRFLFNEIYYPPPASPSVMLYSHPKRLAQYEGPAIFESAGSRGASLEDGDMDELMMKPGRGSPSGRSGPGSPAWIKSAEVQMDKLLLAMKNGDSASNEGTRAALRYLASIIGKESA